MREVIAIDGPSASGKSTVARRVASALGRVYIDSGSLYRGVAWKARAEGTDASDAAAVEELVRGVKMEFSLESGAMSYTVDGIDPGDEIRKKSVNDIVSNVAAVPLVRERVVGWLREMSEIGQLVMEGRDIGTAVFPDARWKFFLKASAEERARRRYEEMQEKGLGTESLEATTKSLKNRDRIDSTREKDPLRVAEGAHEIDSTGMTIDEVVSLIVDKVSEN